MGRTYGSRIAFRRFCKLGESFNRMKTTILYTCFLVIVLMSSLVSCIPDNIKDQMDQNLEMAQTMMADQKFKNAIAHIELHKVRNGSYPQSLTELQFLPAMDSSLNSVVYQKLDSGYELNINFKRMSLAGSSEGFVTLQYPPEFWKGLGCVRSNTRKE
jgi:hypothetical protein